MPDRPARRWPALDVTRFGGADRLQAALAPFDVAAIDERADDSWRVFFHTTAERDRAARTLGDAFDQLGLSPVEVADEDWAARTQSDLRAVLVGGLVVAPPWDVPRTIVIRPSRGFGTGHHATTRLCLAALQLIDLPGTSVLDVGTGSGVLAIAASLLGAGAALGIDDDPDAIESARENLTLNAVPNVGLAVEDLWSADVAPADVVLANLTGSLLIGAAARLARLTTAGGRLILSGFTADEEAGVRAAFADRLVEHRAQEDEWVCVTLVGG